MAVRKAAIRQQGEARVREALEPGESLDVVLFAVGGPSPLLVYTVLGALGGTLAVHPYFVALTDRRLLFVKASKLSGRPKDVVDSQPRSDIALVDHKPRAIWSVVRLRRSDGNEQRLNVHRQFKPELAAFAAALRSGAAG
ncbi:MAG: hypothetical protein ABR518_00905 [Actinomycetota bacterium]